ncbi:MAG: Flp family type IVb pilin [Planctomycetaceae bacterium]
MSKSFGTDLPAAEPDLGLGVDQSDGQQQRPPLRAARRRFTLPSGPSPHDGACFIEAWGVVAVIGSPEGIPERVAGITGRSEKDKKMANLLKSVKTFMVSEDGPTAVEYAVMLALIVIVCLTAIRAVGTTASDRFNDIKDNLTP